MIERLTAIFPYLLPITIVAIVIFLGGAIYIFISPLIQAGKGELGSAGSDAARSLITFFVAMVTVAIAIILTLSVLLSTATDYDKRFAQGKEILTIFVGILGTIVGFYFGSAPKQPDLPQSPITLAAAQGTPQPAITAVKDFETKGFGALLNEDYAASLDAFQQAFKVSPDYHNVSEIKDLLEKNQDQFYKGTAAEKAAVWNAIYCTVASKLMWKAPAEVKTQLQQKMQAANFPCRA